MPAFFTEVKEMNSLSNEIESYFHFKDGENSYWNRREKKHWVDLPDIF